MSDLLSRLGALELPGLEVVEFDGDWFVRSGLPEGQWLTNEDDSLNMTGCKLLLDTVPDEGWDIAVCRYEGKWRCVITSEEMRFDYEGEGVPKFTLEAIDQELYSHAVIEAVTLFWESMPKNNGAFSA